MLTTTRYDGPQAVPLLIAHGLFGSARNWGVIARKLAAARPVIVADMRNHGDSPWYPTHGYADMAGDLAALIALIDRPMDVLGHSMGGKAAMVLALQRPHLLRKLVVADIAPVSYAHSQNGLIAAMRRIDPASVGSRAAAKALLGDLAPGVADFLLQSLDLKDKRWRLNLDVLEAEMTAITGFPAIAASFAGPSLFVTGAQSDYVTPAHRPAIAALFPQARYAEIAGAGHWLHAEQPQAFVAAVTEFLG